MSTEPKEVRERKRQVRIAELKAADPERTGETLLDMEVGDIDNFDHLLRHESEVFYFPSLFHCAEFMTDCFFFAMKKVGVDIGFITQNKLRATKVAAHVAALENRIPRLVDNVMEAQKVRVERRSYEDPLDQWRDGLYIFKAGEIAYVVGNSETHPMGDIHHRYSVRTNVPVEDENKKIFIMPAIMDGRNTPDFLKGKVAADGFGA